MTTPRWRATATPPVGTGPPIVMTVVGTTATATGCKPSTGYQVDVTAIGDGVTTADSVPETIFIRTKAGTIPDEATRLLPPQNLLEAARSPTSCLVEWDASGNTPPFSYKGVAIELNTGRDRRVNGTLHMPQRTSLFESLEPATWYEIQVRAFREGSSGLDSVPAKVKVQTMAPSGMESQLDDLYAKTLGTPRDAAATVDAQLGELEAFIGITDIAGKTPQQRITALYESI